MKNKMWQEWEKKKELKILNNIETINVKYWNTEE